MTRRTNVPQWLEKYNRWQIKIQKDGQRRTFYSSTPGRRGKRECQDKADAWLEDNIVEQNVAVNVQFRRWITDLKISTSKSHWSVYEGFGRNYIIPCKGRKSMFSLTEQDLQEVINYAFKSPVNKRPLSEKTLKDLRSCLMSFVKFGRKTGATRLIPENLYIPKGAKKSERTTLQPDDVKVLFNSSKVVIRGREVDDWYIHAYRFEVVTGLRPGEIAGLEKRDVENNICSIKRSYNRHGELTEGKTAHAQRRFVLPEIAAQILSEQEAMLKKAGVVCPYVFPSSDGNRMNTNRYYKRWLKYREHNGISDRSLYELRHTFFSVNKSLPVELLKQMGGHGQSFDTFGSYGHEIDGESARLAALINDEFSKLII